MNFINDPSVLLYIIGALAGALVAMMIWVGKRLQSTVDTLVIAVNSIITKIAVLETYNAERPHNQRKNDR